MKYHIPCTLALLLLYACTATEGERVVSTPKVVNIHWKGKWERKMWMRGADLKIDSVTADSLQFSLRATSGGHAGTLQGDAAVTDDYAVYTNINEMDSCVVEFRLSGDSFINIVQKHGECFAGSGVTYSGKYLSGALASEKTEETNLLELGIFHNKKEDSVFRTMVGKYYTLFVNTTQVSTEDNDIDNLKTRVVSSGVTGLFTTMENIIMIDSVCNIWAAVIDNKDNKVLYFTNREEYYRKLPYTIDNWRKRFREYEVLHKSKVN